jgi:hypothetical protein
VRNFKNKPIYESLSNIQQSTAPSEAAGKVMIAMSQALASKAQNATAAQQQDNVLLQAVIPQGLDTIMSIDETATGKKTK